VKQSYDVLYGNSRRNFEKCCLYIYTLNLPVSAISAESLSTQNLFRIFNFGSWIVKDWVWSLYGWHRALRGIARKCAKTRASVRSRQSAIFCLDREARFWYCLTGETFTPVSELEIFIDGVATVGNCWKQSTQSSQAFWHHTHQGFLLVFHFWGIRSPSPKTLTNRFFFRG